MFKDAWLQAYFSSLPWYRPNPSFRDDQLTSVEKQNALKILAYEKTALSAMTAFEG